MATTISKLQFSLLVSTTFAGEIIFVVISTTFAIDIYQEYNYLEIVVAKEVTVPTPEIVNRLSFTFMYKKVETFAKDILGKMYVFKNKEELRFQNILT